MEGTILCRFCQQEGAAYANTDLPALVSRLDSAVKAYVCARRELRARKVDPNTVLSRVEEIARYSQELVKFAQEMLVEQATSTRPKEARQAAFD